MPAGSRRMTSWLFVSGLRVNIERLSRRIFSFLRSCTYLSVVSVFQDDATKNSYFTIRESEFQVNLS